MQITVLGVTRPLGSHAAKKALDHGHTVCVVARRGEDSIPDSVKLHENATKSLQIFEGDATDEQVLKEATYKSDAVLNFVGGRGNLKTTVVSDTTKVNKPPHTRLKGYIDNKRN
jgi:nucleoside-diphosphate-sugar epimerase